MVFDWFKRDGLEQSAPTPSPESTPEPSQDSSIHPDPEPTPEPTTESVAPSPEDEALAWAREAYARLKAQQAQDSSPLPTTAPEPEPAEVEQVSVVPDPPVATSPPEPVPTPTPSQGLSLLEQAAAERQQRQQDQDARALEAEPTPSPVETANVSDEPILGDFDEDFTWSAEVLAAQGRRVDDISLEEIDWLGRLRRGLEKTRQGFVSGLLDNLGDDPLTPEVLDDLETLLLRADAGVQATDQVLDALRQRMNVEVVDPAEGIRFLKEQLRGLLDAPIEASGAKCWPLNVISSTSG